MEKLPIGIQTFEKLREDGYLYVDKTQLLYEIAREGGYYFLARPRRFGKSLTVSTIKALFEGKKELFEGLWIADRYDFSQSFPVVHLELSNLGHRELGLTKGLNLVLDEQAKNHGLSLADTAPGKKLEELVKALASKYGTKVAVLIDEYDKPIVDYLDDPDKAEEARGSMKSFYAPLKSLDPHLRLVFLTGVSKFSRMSIFSELNNLKDLSLHPKFVSLTGYTEAEMQQYFGERAKQVAQDLQLPLADTWKQIRHWYNGYTWDGKTRIYNPFSILSFFDAGDFQNFWFYTGTPTFLVKLLNSKLPYDLEAVETSQSGVETFSLRKAAKLPLLFQTGYLTIKKKEGLALTLGFPNNEVRQSMTDYLLTDLAYSYQGEVTPMILGMVRALRNDELDLFFEHADALFTEIPADIFLHKKEAYYQTVLYLAFVLMGQFVECEPRQRRGRPDLVVHFEDRIYIIEFKLDQSPEEALKQIHEKGYADPYRKQGKQLLLVGVGFSSQKKGVESWVVETI